MLSLIVEIYLMPSELPVFGLEARMETGQEGVVCRKCQNPLLCHCALDVVILDDHVLLQHLEFCGDEV